MKQSVTEYSREELERMFPVEMKPHDPRWAGLFSDEAARITGALGAAALRIEHFGSTSIPGIAAKDTIDILLGIPDDADHGALTETMRGLGYEMIWHPDGDPPYPVFIKGYGPDGVKGQTFHVHAAPLAHRTWERLLFRDYLRAQPGTAKAYETLKLNLAQQYRFERRLYRAAKTDFVMGVMERARGGTLP